MTIAKESTQRRALGLYERLALEAEPYFTGLSVENATVTDGMSISALNLPTLSRAFWCETIEVSSNRLIVAGVGIGSSVQSVFQHNHRFVVPAGGTVTVPVKAFIRPEHVAAGTGAIGGISVRKVLDATPTNGYVYGYANGWAIYDDLNFGADKTMLVIGDSILNSTTGVTSKTQSMEWLTRGWFQAKGYNIRIINKSLSGSTSSDHEFKRALGGYDFPQVDYIHYQLGTNDAGNSLAPATSRANLASAIAWKQRLYPAAKMIVWGSTPRNDTFETQLIATRAAQLAAVTAANDPKVLFCSLGSAFDRTVGANTADGIHPTAVGHAASYSVISAFLAAQGSSGLTI